MSLSLPILKFCLTCLWESHAMDAIKDYEWNSI